LQKRNATVAVIGAGDYIGGEIAKKFASEGFTVFAGRRNGAKLGPLVKEIEKAGGEIHARSLDARKEEEIISFLGDADKHAPLEVCIFNIGANVNFPILDTTERVFRKVNPGNVARPVSNPPCPRHAAELRALQPLRSKRQGAKRESGGERCALLASGAGTARPQLIRQCSARPDKIDAGKLIEKVGLGSTKQVRDDEVVPLICPTCQMLSRDRQSHPCQQPLGYFAWGCFRYFS
jgi:NAD(P)-dependent dehydrogenase (short-subunit alcohol dehydrogenase family)